MQTIPFIDLTRPFAQLQQGSMVLGLAILALIIFGASVLIEAIVLWRAQVGHSLANAARFIYVPQLLELLMFTLFT